MIAPAIVACFVDSLMWVLGAVEMSMENPIELQATEKTLEDEAASPVPVQSHTCANKSQKKKRKGNLSLIHLSLD